MDARDALFEGRRKIRRRQAARAASNSIALPTQAVPLRRLSINVAAWAGAAEYMELSAALLNQANRPQTGEGDGRAHQQNCRLSA